MMRALALLVFCPQFQETIPQRNRAPVPDAKALAEAEKLVKDLFKEDYSKKSTADKSALASRLLEQARQVKDDRSSQYVLYREGQDLLAQVGDLARCFSVLDEWGKEFAVDVLDLKSKAVATVAKAARTPEDARNLASHYLKLADAALMADEYDLAEKTLQSGSNAARKAANVPLVNRFAARSKEAADLKTRHDKIRRAGEALAKNPEDPAANLVVGRFQCVVKGNFAAGLACLAKGSDAALRTLAEKDLQNTSDAAAQCAIADGWWDLAEKESGAAREHLRTRALQWYEKAAPKITGLSKTKAERRVNDGYAQRVLRGSWTDMLDPKNVGLSGKAGEPFDIPSAKRATLTFPKGDFDGFTMKFREGGDAPLYLQIEYESRSKAIFLDYRAMPRMSGHHLEGTTWKTDLAATFEARPEYQLTALFEDGLLKIFVDGREKLRLPSEVGLLGHLMIYPWEGFLTLDQLKLRMRE